MQFEKPIQINELVFFIPIFNEYKFIETNI